MSERAERDRERTLVLVRHAESIWNAENRWQGQADVPLSPRGEREARALGERLRAEPFDLVVTSDLSRARATAEAIVEAQRAAGLEASLEASSGLREIDVGDMTGISHAEAQARFGDHLRAMIRGEDRPVGGRGESLPGFEARVLGAVTALLEERPGASRILLVMHGGCVRALVRHALGLVSRRRALEGVSNTSITRLVAEGGRIRALASFNDASHLAALEGHPMASRWSQSDEHEVIAGAAARARIHALLQLAHESLLVEPGDETTTWVDAKSARLVRYAVPTSTR